MRVRKNVKKLSPDEKSRFVKAVLALKAQDSVIHPGAQSRYDDFVETHLAAMWDFSANMMRTLSWGHVDSVFLPWHRELLYQFEQLLQSVDPTVTIPYWDWTRERSSADAGFPFKHDFIGVDGTDADSDRVKREPGAPMPYPYPFDPEAWSTTVKVIDPGDTLNFFQRQFGERSDAPTLPLNDSNVTGTGTNFRAAINAANSYTTLRARSEDLHNLVHRWTGGNMLRMTSPNDPVFFLHHAQIDRMWSIWQKKVPPGTSFYVASSNAAGHKLNDAMIFNEGAPAPFPTGATPADMQDGHAIHGVGVWYDSDIPEIQAPAPSLDFVGIPEGLTSYKAVRFKIKGGRQVRFRITGAPTGQFGLTPMGTEFKADPVDADDFYYGYVWVQVTSIAGPIPNSSIAIHAYLVEEEGYYTANEGDEYPLGDYTVTLTATSVPRENNAVALVLDRSGSMASPAGGTSTRSSLLGSAIGVFRTLMLPNDEVAVATFDDVVTAAIPMQSVSGAPVFSTVDISPRGATWIGGGIQQGAVELAAATHTNRSMLVLTDGNENVHPYISELPAGTVTSRTYAIGFGLPGEVSDQALNQITSNTHGDLIVTGNITTDEQRFELTKYFVQVLAGVTNAQVLLDPNGKLFFGSHDVIPFAVSDADVYVDAIVLCPVPQFLDFVLETPGGTLIKPTIVAPNVQFIIGQNVACYRMVLPALAASPGGSHGGGWKAHLALRDRNDIDRLMRRRALASVEVSPRLDKNLPYSFIVHATSNIQLAAWRLQESYRPGASIHVYASLKEYEVPFPRHASVWVEGTRPDGSTFMLALREEEAGRYAASFTASFAGVYKCRVMAEGLSSKGMPFTREKTLTAGVYDEGDRHGDRGDSTDLICRLLHCVFEEHEVLRPAAVRRLTEWGIDVKQFVKCIEEVCPEWPKEGIPGLKDKLTDALLKRPQLISHLAFAASVRSQPIKVMAMTKPKKRPAAHKMRATHKMPATHEMAATHELHEVETMFMPLDLAVEEKRVAGKPATSKRPKGHGRRHKR
jgi:Common central domain of tyrosinase/von Willebrand factor type A domain